VSPRVSPPCPRKSKPCLRESEPSLRSSSTALPHLHTPFSALSVPLQSIPFFCRAPPATATRYLSLPSPCRGVTLISLISKTLVSVFSRFRTLPLPLTRIQGCWRIPCPPTSPLCPPLAEGSEAGGSPGVSGPAPPRPVAFGAKAGPFILSPLSTVFAVFAEICCNSPAFTGIRCCKIVQSCIPSHN
jgi:hypothetical protein